MSLNLQELSFHRGLDNSEQYSIWLDDKDGLRPSISFLGRSNVGKSTLINALFGKKAARTSKTPGRTQQINLFQGKTLEEGLLYNFYLYDLPGFGHARVSKEMGKTWSQIIDQHFQSLEKHDLVVYLVDARHEVQKADIEFINYLKEFKPATLVILNKIDKLKTQKEKAAFRKRFEKISHDFSWCKQLFPISAIKIQGNKELKELSTFLQKFIINNES